MSEKLKLPEQHEAGGESKAEKIEVRTERSEQKQSHEHKHKQNIEQIRHKAEEAALSSDQARAEAGKSQPQPVKEEYVSREAKKVTYERTMLKVRRRLSPVARTGSKIIHQPVVEAVSEATGKTVARPSGLLFGGIIAFIGTSAYYLFARHYNYSYSYTVYLTLLVAGLFAGWVIEALWRGANRSK